MENLFKKNPLQDLLSSLNAVISTNERIEFITGHVIFIGAYNEIFLLKITYTLLDLGVKEENTPRKVSSKRLVHTTKGPP